MGDKEKKAVGGAVAGATAGSIFGPAGTLVGGLVGAAFGSSQGLEEHHQAVLDTYNAVNDAHPDAKVYTDHIDPDGSAGNPEGEVPGVDGKVPDLVVKQQGGTQLIVEVEREEMLDGDAVEQLAEFTGARGYTTLLVVPEESVREPANQFVVDHEAEIAGQVTVATPDEVSGYL